MRLDKSHKIFFELLKAGLWGGLRPVQEFKSLKVQDFVDWEKVYQLAQEQSLQGIVLEGVEELRAKNIELNVLKALLLQWIGEVQVIEQRNKEMNVFLASLLEKLKAAQIKALLVKGQGIAQCYERPYWRVSGDIDFLLDKENYERGKKFLSGIAQDVHKENDFDEHFSVILDGWDVELHGSQLGAFIFYLTGLIFRLTPRISSLSTIVQLLPV